MGPTSLRRGDPQPSPAPTAAWAPGVALPCRRQQGSHLGWRPPGRAPGGEESQARESRGDHRESHAARPPHSWSQLGAHSQNGSWAGPPREHRAGRDSLSGRAHSQCLWMLGRTVGQDCPSTQATRSLPHKLMLMLTPRPRPVCSPFRADTPETLLPLGRLLWLGLPVFVLCLSLCLPPIFLNCGKTHITVYCFKVLNSVTFSTFATWSSHRHGSPLSALSSHSPVFLPLVFPSGHFMEVGSYAGGLCGCFSRSAACFQGPSMLNQVSALRSFSRPSNIPRSLKLRQETTG